MQTYETWLICLIIFLLIVLVGMFIYRKSTERYTIDLSKVDQRCKDYIQ